MYFSFVIWGFVPLAEEDLFQVQPRNLAAKKWSLLLILCWSSLTELEQDFFRLTSRICFTKPAGFTHPQKQPHSHCDMLTIFVVFAKIYFFHHFCFLGTILSPFWGKCWTSLAEVFTPALMRGLQVAQRWKGRVNIFQATHVWKSNIIGYTNFFRQQYFLRGRHLYCQIFSKRTLNFLQISPGNLLRPKHARSTGIFIMLGKHFLGQIMCAHANKAWHLEIKG